MRQSAPKRRGELETITLFSALYPPMDNRGIAALALAREAGFIVSTTAELAACNVVGDRLEVGPLVSPDRIATMAARKQLRREGCFGELAVFERVAAQGYYYTPEPWRVVLC